MIDQVVSFKVSATMFRLVDKTAKRLSSSRSEVIRAALEQYLISSGQMSNENKQYAIVDLNAWEEKLNKIIDETVQERVKSVMKYLMDNLTKIYETNDFEKLETKKLF